MARKAIITITEKEDDPQSVEINLAFDPSISVNETGPHISMAMKFMEMLEEDESLEGGSDMEIDVER